MENYESPDTLLLQIKQLIRKAAMTFHRFEKYSRCYSILSISEEMQTIYNQIGVVYLKIQQVKNFKDTAKDTFVIIDQAELQIQDRDIFFKDVIAYLNRNYKPLSFSLENLTLNAIISEQISKLEDKVKQAEKIAGRMELAIMGSQQIYLVPITRNEEIEY